MATSKYVDMTAIINVIGIVYNHPFLLDYEDKYNIVEDDFPEKVHQIIFGTIQKLWQQGVQKISLQTIADFLSSRPKNEAIYKNAKGDEWLLKASDNCKDKDSFDYYYQRMKKFTLLRAYDNFGVDVSDIYDPDNIIDAKRKQAQEEYLDSSSLVDIADRIDDKISQVRSKFIESNEGELYQAGTGIEALIEKFKEFPEVGLPLYGSMINTITRGARLKKLYLRSAATGVGKTRSMIADTCMLGCDKVYDPMEGWVKVGAHQPTLFITTEQELEEVQTMMLAFLANVDEEHILNGKYIGDEEIRVFQAAKVLQESPVYIEELPDFSLRDIENVIKKNIRDHGVTYIMHDYIHTSLKILEEITRRSGGVKLREDNILFMLSTKLKDICNQYGVFILSATQLSGDYDHAETPDQNLLRGAKAIADKIDYGSLILKVTSEDVESLKPVLDAGHFSNPQLKISVYKNRRGRYKGIYLWCSADLSTCRINPMFATDYNYNLIKIDNVKVAVQSEEFLQA